MEWNQSWNALATAHCNPEIYLKDARLESGYPDIKHPLHTHLIHAVAGVHIFFYMIVN
jgi:hypothetical protein